jgi:transcriptional regulator with XRE-family HTH domain
VGPAFRPVYQEGPREEGYSVEQVAGLAGLEASAWAAFEAGRVPETVVQLRSMAGALEFSDVQMATLVQLCRDAWEG